jgi:hypothetical protein
VAIDVTVAGDSIRWCYRSLGNEWREQLPLNTLIPYPTTTIDHSSHKFGVATIVGVPAIGGIAFWLIGFGYIAISVIAITLLLGILAIALAYRRGPIEWATFSTYYPDKTVYLFRNPGDLNFDLFLEHLQTAILDAGGLCGTNRDLPEDGG